MPLFACENCGCIENTACCFYWPNKADNKKNLCSYCDPQIGVWHNDFPKRSAEGMLIDNRGHLWSQETIDQGRLPSSLRIVGKIMKIIKSGVLPSERTYQASCKKCNTIFEFKRSEAEAASSCRNESLLVITCPLSGCGEKVWVDEHPVTTLRY